MVKFWCRACGRRTVLSGMRKQGRACEKQKFCRECGVELLERAKFCSVCGATVVSDEELKKSVAQPGKILSVTQPQKETSAKPVNSSVTSGNYDARSSAMRKIILIALKKFRLRQ